MIQILTVFEQTSPKLWSMSLSSSLSMLVRLAINLSLWHVDAMAGWKLFSSLKIVQYAVENSVDSYDNLRAILAMMSSIEHLSSDEKEWVSVVRSMKRKF